MTMTFSNAPLLEVVAELRWGEIPPPPVPGVPMLLPGRPDAETFFIRLGGELHQYGFNRVERVIPPGFPLLPFQPVYRYRSDTASESSIFFQAGPGLFVINAVPPYRSWDTVEPFVARGVRALLKARGGAEHDKQFEVANLRYINGFSASLTDGRDVGGLLSDVFGFGITYPEPILKHLRAGTRIEPHLQLTVPLARGASLAITIAQGTINNEPRIIMDSAVTGSEPVPADEQHVMSSFRNARNVIHDIFVGLTKPIHHLLQPIGDDNHAA